MQAVGRSEGAALVDDEERRGGRCYYREAQGGDHGGRTQPRDRGGRCVCSVRGADQGG